MKYTVYMEKEILASPAKRRREVPYHLNQEWQTPAVFIEYITRSRQIIRKDTYKGRYFCDGDQDEPQQSLFHIHSYFGKCRKGAHSPDGEGDAKYQSCLIHCSVVNLTASKRVGHCLPLAWLWDLRSSARYKGRGTSLTQSSRWNLPEQSTSQQNYASDFRQYCTVTIPECRMSENQYFRSKDSLRNGRTYYECKRQCL